MTPIGGGCHISCVTMITSMRAHVSILRDSCVHTLLDQGFLRAAASLKLCRPCAPFSAAYMNKSQFQPHR